MTLPSHKTKIVATIGPASESPDRLEALIRAGMRIARLNFSHGDFAGHAERIRRLRAAEEVTGQRISIFADLPGPKMRLGDLGVESVEVRPGDSLTLTTEDIVGTAARMSVTFERLPAVVKRGDHLFLNDGIVQLKVEQVEGREVQCRVTVGGELRSRKGLNLPRIDLGISAFTERDRECLEFALRAGVDAVSQSFVEGPADIEAVRQAARAIGYDPFVVAKIERSRALDRLDEILAAADGVMVARGDLGVEVPIETIAQIQKSVVARANAAGKPVITATQMLESMVSSRIPTRAEATDVANAILDGTDAIMLSAESAIGRHPVEAVAMLARIATVTEPTRGRSAAALEEPSRHRLAASAALEDMGAGDGFANVVEEALAWLPCAVALVPTKAGTTARRLARYKPSVWIVALSPSRAVGQGLQFCYGVWPVDLAEEPADWGVFAREWTRAHGIDGTMALLVAGPSPRNPRANHRLEFLALAEAESSGSPSP